MQHLCAWYESKDPAGALLPLNGVPEQTIMVTGDDIRVPPGLANIIGKAAVVNHATVARAQVQSPSLRMLTNLDIEPIVVSAVVFGSPPEAIYHPSIAIPVMEDESLNFAIASTPGGAVAHYGLVWLADGAQAPATGQMFTLRATATVAQAVATWTNGNMTFDQVLPAGRYQVVGMRARSADGLAARLVFPEQIPRPGVAMVNAIADLDVIRFRSGRGGVLGEFPHTIPPTLDVLGGAAAAQVIFIDLIKVG